MISSINNVDRHRTGAEAFVNMNDKDLTKIASRANSIAHHKEYKRVNNAVDFAVKSLPVVAAVSAFAVTKNPKKALKQGALWGALVGVPELISKANNDVKKQTATHENPNGKGMSFGTQLIVSLAGYIGASAIINDVAKNAKLNQFADKVIAKSKDIYNGVAGKVKVPESVSQKTGEFMQKAKDVVPGNVKNYVTENISKVKDSNVLQTVAGKSKGVGKTLLRYAPELVLGTAIAGSLAYGVKAGQHILATKNKMKQEQFETAKNLITSYKTENEDLKAKLAEKNNAAEQV